MSWKLRDLTLGSGSVVPDAAENGDALSLTLLVSVAERRQLAEMCRYAGKVLSVDSIDGTTEYADPTGTLNTLYVESDAATYVESGFYVVRSHDDRFDGSTKARVRLDLQRICGVDEAAGDANAFSEFLAHDF